MHGLIMHIWCAWSILPCTCWPCMFSYSCLISAMSSWTIMSRVFTCFPVFSKTLPGCCHSLDWLSMCILPFVTVPMCDVLLALFPGWKKIKHCIISHGLWANGGHPWCQLSLACELQPCQVIQVCTYALAPCIWKKKHFLLPCLFLFFSLRLNCPSIQDLCSVNASVAAAYDRRDLVHTWRTAALIADKKMGVPSEPDRGMPWAMHPFGRQLVHSLWAWL